MNKFWDSRNIKYHIDKSINSQNRIITTSKNGKDRSFLESVGSDGWVFQIGVIKNKFNLCAGWFLKYCKDCSRIILLDGNKMIVIENIWDRLSKLVYPYECKRMGGSKSARINNLNISSRTIDSQTESIDVFLTYDDIKDIVVYENTIILEEKENSICTQKN